MNPFPFPKARNIETAFQHVRLFCIFLMAGSLGLAGFISWQAMRMSSRAQERVYILASGKALEALAADRRENIPVEARDHIRSFHQYFFRLDPDEKAINGNISRALYLADASAKRLYDNLKETGFYASIISGNISQQIEVDSISVDLQKYPYYFRCYATQEILRPTSRVTRELMTEGWLRNVGRSDNNPHGFLIERWNILENKDVQVSNR